MRWINQKSLYGRRVHTVELTPEEQALPDAELVTRADNYGEPGPVCHFGGSVARGPDNTATISVYTD